jgi:hypothetical protein
MEETRRFATHSDGTTYEPKSEDVMEFIRKWKIENPDEYEQIVEHQAREAAARAREAEAYVEGNSAAYSHERNKAAMQNDRSENRFMDERKA